MWFTYSQNNSGGYLHQDENVGYFIAVEADTPEEADAKALEITEDYSDFCQCCGERWYIDSTTNDGCVEPMYYGKPIRDMSAGYSAKEAVLYHKDGRKERLILPVKEAE